MPLIAGKSPKSFSKNVATEMNAGRPQKQSLAIAYAMKKRAKRMAEGGDVSDEEHEAVPNYMDFLESHPEMEKATPPPDFDEKVRRDIDDSEFQTSKDYMAAEGGIMKPGMIERIMKKRRMAAGGFVEEEEAQYDPIESPMPRRNRMAMEEDDRDLGQHGEIETGPMGGYAEGGQITDNEQDAMHEMDMIGRIMKQRQKCFSEGGRVANTDRITAGFKPANYDDLSLRDDLEGSYTGENSGDELGNAQEDADRKDIVARILRSRAKKDRMPRPA